MDIEPARLLTSALVPSVDSLWLPGNSTIAPRNSHLPVIEHVTNHNQFRIIVFF
jgi:hypothetical protein